MADRIDYQALMHAAMRGLVADLLGRVAETGLPGAHHFFITFDTTEAGVAMADWLRAKYPRDMTIVLQHWFADLCVEGDAFTVTLNFGNRPETLTVPLSAIRTFVDPAAEFGLRFDVEEAEDASAEEAEEAPFAEASEEDAPHRDADIVRLDTFRK